MFNSILNKVNTGGDRRGPVQLVNMGGDCRGPVQLVNTGGDCRGPVQLGALSLDVHSQPVTNYCHCTTMPEWTI